ncbi:hypothetical protein EW146_g381 [Bondarzewia mesenterica]|uniref:Bacteriophage T5 Orf172 DNA-binding domain-containing protein n=1 Tax=Bondarzewia mesenterica TaxID=1095465 RepID=A0A4S4M7E9_9AGAM|nr:hypothetical protein EW146_g381 [Bondarzewia mesenterica]
MSRHQPIPIKRPSINTSNTNDSSRDLVESFDALALAGRRKPSTSTGPRRSGEQNIPHAGAFIGGFNPGFIPPPGIIYPQSEPVRTDPVLFSGHITVKSHPDIPHGSSDLTRLGRVPPLPHPPAPLSMPTPQHGPRISRTMQYATMGIAPSPPPSISTPAPTPPATLTKPHSDPIVPTSIASSSRTPQRPRVSTPEQVRRTASEPLSPVSTSSTPGRELEQCSGITLAGKRCTRKAKKNPYQDKVYCHQHKIKDDDFLVLKKNEFVTFADWIPDYLSSSTQDDLREEMSKTRSSSDKEGYIYAFLIRDSDMPDHIHIKVGRTTNLNRRIDQWDKQCFSKQQNLLGWWPGGLDTGETSVIKGRVKAGQPGAWCHRLERLVHLELADLVANMQYLDSGWPQKVVTEPKKGADKIESDTAHKEIFTFRRVKEGRYEGNEWELIVKPVIEKWGGFVSNARSPLFPLLIEMFSSLVALAAVASLAAIPPTLGVEHQVVVGGPGILQYNPSNVTADPGDVVTFIFKQKNHTVTQSTFANPCQQSNGGFDTSFVFVPDNATDNFPVAQFTVEDTNPVWVYCRQADHCQLGMVFAINPGDKLAAFQAAATGNATSQSSAVASSAAASSTVAATATASATGSGATPTPTSSSSSTDHRVIVGGPNNLTFQPANITAQPNDTITFEFHQKNHTATQSTFASPCVGLTQSSTSGQVGFNSGFVPVSDNATSFPTFTIKVNDSAPIWAFCAQANHCGSGMVFSVNANESSPNTFAAFQARAKQINGTSSNSTSSPSGSSNGATSLHRSAGIAIALISAVLGLFL